MKERTIYKLLKSKEVGQRAILAQISVKSTPIIIK